MPRKKKPDPGPRLPSRREVSEPFLDPESVQALSLDVRVLVFRRELTLMELFRCSTPDRVEDTLLVTWESMPDLIGTTIVKADGTVVSEAVCHGRSYDLSTKNIKESVQWRIALIVDVNCEHHLMDTARLDYSFNDDGLQLPKPNHISHAQFKLRRLYHAHAEAFGWVGYGPIMLGPVV